LKPGIEITANAKIVYGRNYIIPRDLQAGFQNFQDYSKLVGEGIDHSSCRFEKDGDGWYYFPKKAAEAQIGDFRAKFDYIADSPATVLGLQCQETGETFYSLVPYRMVERPCCGDLPEETLSKALLEASKEQPGQYAAKDHVDAGSLCLFCCFAHCCNLISTLFATVVGIPQVYQLWDQHQTIKESFTSLYHQTATQKWLARFLGWCLLLAATNALFQPLLVLIDVIPFLGKYISGLLGSVIFVICALVTFIVAFIVVAVANLRYHPLWGILFLSLAGALAVGIKYVHPSA